MTDRIPLKKVNVERIQEGARLETKKRLFKEVIHNAGLFPISGSMILAQKQSVSRYT
jgi:hypothetical protein